MNKHEEYLRRNLVVCKAVGAQAAISKAMKRLEQQKRPPKWLLGYLQQALTRLPDIPFELAAWRNSSPDAPDDVRDTRPFRTTTIVDVMNHKKE